MYENDSTASFLDKTDWRKTIHKSLEDCVRAEGTIFYTRRVKSLISAFAAPYPNFNARKLVEERLNHLEDKYSELEIQWLNVNATARREQKRKKKQELTSCLCHDMFDFIKDLCATKRMLLWGTKDILRGDRLIDKE